jgi:hypothetical protein
MICPTGGWELACPSPSEKISLFPFAPNHRLISRHPVPDRGAFRDRHGRRVWDAVDAAASSRGSAAQTSDETADGEVVWSRRPDAGVNFVMMLRITRGMVATKPGHQGDHEGNR